MRLSAAIQHIQHIASIGLAPRIAIPEMVDALQFVIPSSTNCFVWLGATGQPVDLYERHPIPEALDAFMMQTAQLEQSGQPSFAKLVRAKGEFGNWWQFTAFDGWDRSVMKNELFRPYNIGNNMDFLLRDRGHPLALLTINREPESAPFRPAEITAMLALRAHFIHALHAPEAIPETGRQVADRDIATMLVEPDGQIAAMGPDAAMLLHQLKPAAARLPIATGQVPEQVMAVIGRLHRVSSGRASLPASSDVATQWGTIRITAHPLSVGDAVIVSFQRLLPLAIRQLRNLAQAPLTPAERRIAFQLCSDHDMQAIAHDAGVTLASAREYSKRIRAKLEVNNRDGVRAIASA